MALLNICVCLMCFNIMFILKLQFVMYCSVMTQYTVSRFNWNAGDATGNNLTQTGSELTKVATSLNIAYNTRSRTNEED